MTYAEKVWEDAHNAFAEGALYCGGHQEAVAIISAALKKQREACLEAFYHGPRPDAYRDIPEWLSQMRAAILSAEVEE